MKVNAESANIRLLSDKLSVVVSSKVNVLSASVNVVISFNVNVVISVIVNPVNTEPVKEPVDKFVGNLINTLI